MNADRVRNSIKTVILLLLACVFYANIAKAQVTDTPYIVSNYSCPDAQVNDYSVPDSDSIQNANASVILKIKNYQGTYENVHPKVLYFPSKLWGYRYWMAYTPYPATNAKYENPSIAVSNDGINWTVPKGLVNPIAPPSTGGYNSDPHLVYRSDIATMELYYRPVAASGLSSLARKTSIDGINWSAEEILISDHPHGDLLSPSLLFENGIYKMWFVDNDYKQIYYQESAGSTPSNWSTRKLLPVDYNAIMEHPWHLDVVNNQKDGYWIVFTGYGSDGDQNTSDLFAVKQKYDSTFEDPFPIIRKSKNPQAFDSKCIYRSSIVMVDNQFFIYYSCLGAGGWAISIAYGEDLKGLTGLKTTTNLNIESLENTYTRVYVDESKNICIESPDEIQDVAIYGIDGRLFLQRRNIHDTKYVITSNIADKLYIVKVTTDSGIKVEKIIQP